MLAQEIISKKIFWAQIRAAGAPVGELRPRASCRMAISMPQLECESIERFDHEEGSRQVAKPQTGKRGTAIGVTRLPRGS
jgi:hypothetical protein